MRCTKTAYACRKTIADRFDLEPNAKKSWQFEGRCPNCGHGGFSISSPTKVHVPLRHIWHCNCHRCFCNDSDVRKAMERAGIPESCLGTYARDGVAPKDAPSSELRDAMAAVLADDGIRALADLKIRMAEVLWGDAPSDWDGFVAFAERAGVSRSKRYEAAARWGRQRQ